MINVGILGVSGYTGQELLKLLLRHPGVEVTVLVSETFKGKALAEVFPRFSRSRPMILEGADPVKITSRCDTVFLCLPHKESMNVAPVYLDAGVMVFDLSADFRLRDVAVYEKWYGVEHTAAEYIANAVYGLPELYRGMIANANLVAVPGCYPTSVILGLAPVMGEDWIDYRSIVAHSASGATGAGRKVAAEYLFNELDGNYYAYGAPSHRHTPEIEQELSALGGQPVTVTFIPHLLPASRGIYTTITLSMTRALSAGVIREMYRAYYRESRFVTVVEGFPQMKWAHETNGAYIGLAVDERTSKLIVTSTLDNLVKGASGQAVQCFNIRRQLDEAAGLT